MIEVHRTTKAYGPIHAVDGVDLSIGAGELFGLIGHNGAGKSTLFKLMLGLVPANSGEIRIEGQPVRGAGFRQVRRRLGYLPENIVLYDNLTGLETLQFFDRLKGAPSASCAGLLTRVGLGQASQRRVRTYSKGMRQRLGFAQALLGAPRLLFLDEPTNGLDPEGIREFYQILREMQDDGVTIVLTSHILSEIQQRVDRLAVMRNGKIQAVGSVQTLRQAADLPLYFELTLADGAEPALQQALAGLTLDPIQFAPHRATLRCARAGKMALLAAVTSLGEQVLDLHITEPSLEDVFLGYSGGAA